MTNEYKACGAQLDYPPEYRGKSYDEWIKTRVVATQSDIKAFYKKLQAESAAPKKKTHSGALPENAGWL